VTLFPALHLSLIMCLLVRREACGSRLMF